MNYEHVGVIERMLNKNIVHVAPFTSEDCSSRVEIETYAPVTSDVSRST